MTHAARCCHLPPACCWPPLLDAVTSRLPAVGHRCWTLSPPACLLLAAAIVRCHLPPACCWSPLLDAVTSRLPAAGRRCWTLSPPACLLLAAAIGRCHLPPVCCLLASLDGATAHSAPAYLKQPGCIPSYVPGTTFMRTRIALFHQSKSSSALSY